MDMKYIKLFESRSEIRATCRKYHIENYTINRDGTVDVDGDVNLNNRGLTKLPLRFGKVSGYFSCSSNDITTLEGSPTYVGGNFSCYANKLTSLVGGPREVGGAFYCQDNNLVTLDGAPKEIGGYFCCDYNPIHAIYRLFCGYKSYQDSMDYGYLRGTNIEKRRLQEALDELGKRQMPEKIKGYNWI
jgi:hypothetical protein